jgi:hypothetical protein
MKFCPKIVDDELSETFSSEMKIHKIGSCVMKPCCGYDIVRFSDTIKMYHTLF